MGVVSASFLGSLTVYQTAQLLLAAFTIIYLIRWSYTAVYNLYFHPLAAFPGPSHWIIFPILRQIDIIRGVREHKTRQWHERYGEVVRCGSDMLTFTHPDAWKDIYGHGHAELPKFLGTNQNGVESIINARSAQTHFRHRRAMLPAFSDKALGEQMGIMNRYIDLLMTRISEAASDKEGTTDIDRLYNFTTFDLIGDLAFGEDMGGLSNGESTPWLKRIKTVIRMLPVGLLMSQFFPFLQPLLRRTLRKSGNEHRAMVEAMVRKRIGNAEFEHRGDFMDQMMRNRGKEGVDLTDEEHAANADIMMIAGTETTATLLSFATYMLLTHPEKLDRVREEVRAAFESREEMTFASVSKRLPYLLACLQETFRLYPPVPIIMFRETLEGQMTSIAGHLVPGKIKVGVPQLAANTTTANFHDPHSWTPERWLPSATTDPKSVYFNDRREAVRPFSIGPRNCIGQNLAYHEMRLIMARLMWEFDLELDGKSEGWTEGMKVRVFWDKEGLWVRVREREGMKGEQ
ncbi:Isotrichodermin C-15 hydroxylase [Cyphellophora attinorum]|uniref:Isotrichodermin C-15 hydroxylase n=1 Tax=Cyphellophora attinorum TaxID=1664694 RepID=A0A0N1H359_9EURO|nr:Isotrichodermin C-15 hydroxylase [Phialophora attinorum]KPI39335.1 Isotrichodermin C-15 hydroxylase [Phialophora attinorum]